MWRRATPAEPRGLRPLLALAGIVIGLSAGFIVAYRIWFRLPAVIVPIHLALVTGGLVLAMLGSAALQSAARRPSRVALLPVGVFVALLASLDALCWIARSLWVDELSLQTIVFYAPRIVRVAAGATEVPGLLLLGIVAAAGVLALTAMTAAAGPLAAALFEAVDPGGRALFGRAHPAAWSMAAVLAAIALVGGSYRALDASDALAAEPLVGLRRQHRPLPGAGAGVAATPSPLRIGTNALLARRDPREDVEIRRGRKNVVIVVIDSLRPDHVSSAGYRRRTTPALDAFVTGRPALVAEWATSSCSISSCGIMGILGSAQYWRQQAGVVTLPDVLAAAGYDLYFISSGDFSRGYPLLHTMFGAKARMFVDGFTSERYSSNDDRHILDALRDLPPDANRPSFFYFHLHSIHRGGTKYREPTYRPAMIDTGVWAALTGGGTKANAAAVIDDVTPEIHLNDYDNATLQADDVFAEILRTLGARGYLDEAIVVVTADHGEAFGEHGRWGHGHDLHAESIDIPLVVHDTTLARSHRLPYATHVDIAPTVVDGLGIPAPSSWEGQSLFSGTPADSFHQTTHAHPILAAVWRTARGTYKYIVDPKNRTQSLYELESDPGERIDVRASADPRIVAALRGAVAQNFATVLAGTPLPE